MIEINLLFLIIYVLNKEHKSKKTCINPNVFTAMHLHSNLPDGAVFAENVVHLIGGDFVWQISDVQHAVHLRRQPDL